VPLRVGCGALGAIRLGLSTIKLAGLRKNPSNGVVRTLLGSEMKTLGNSEFCRTALQAAAGSYFLLAANTYAQNPSPPPAVGTAEVERVIVTGSNIPTAEETGPNPVDTYRPADIEKLGIRNATDLTTFLPQQSGATTNLNMGNGGDGTVQFNLRGLLAKETLVLVDGKRVALGSLNAVGFSGGVDINLIPFPMIDHIDILKDGASAVYGSDAITGVVNFFLVTQIPWAGDRGQLRQHQLGSV
jgi:outer membrane cobalamin receptor